MAAAPNGTNRFVRQSRCFAYLRLRQPAFHARPFDPVDRGFGIFQGSPLAAAYFLYSAYCTGLEGPRRGRGGSIADMGTFPAFFFSRRPCRIFFVKEAFFF